MKKASIVLTVIIMLLTSCSIIPIDTSRTVTSLEFIWVPNSNLRASSIAITTDDEGTISIFLDVVKDSKMIRDTEILFLNLIEGDFYFKIYYGENTEVLKVFGNGTYIYNETSGKYYVNNSINYYIQQTLYTYYIKNGIRLE